MSGYKPLTLLWWSKTEKERLHRHRPPNGKQTCTDDAVCGELLGQRLHVGVMMRVELPAGDTEVKAQPGGVAVNAAVPLDILVAFLTSTHPAPRVMGWIWLC